MSNETEKETDTEIGARESRLLDAMSADFSAAETTPPAEYSAFAGKELPKGETKAQMFDIVSRIRTVSDPEIPLNVYDMGLIYKTEQRDNGDIYIEMTLTAPTCPIAGVLPQQVADAVAGVAGTGRVEVRLVWEPAWSIDRLTDEGKELLELI